ncbi:hypothetical protein GFS24_24595 [Chitinophaga sp. SYP-B3965]|uniref:glycoside hydrolase family 18 n=1 Tax=Chitinophaga sp. SYP-B3965 TaxID=2663120 RepID=UPI001299DA41|nr:glycoside hydrolase family 18 [Chitinophaga sp. SYP-B3965]MRG48318.1 hypothetical protein [Chitinophaga sp. SYP-B3965]
MKTKLFYLSLLCLAGLMTACEKQNTPEALQIEVPRAYSAQYYANLRAYKKTDHQVFYGWFAAYGNKEGVTADYKQSPSYGEHIAGLPDSLDFCSLWSGVPSLRKGDSLSTYNPIAYSEMRYAMEVKGIKMLLPEITRMQKYAWLTLDDAGIKKYGDYLIKMVMDNDVDGLDLDYEPEGDWLTGDKFLQLVVYIGQYLGPKSSNPDKYLVIDYYTQIPPAAVEPYINFLVNQSYTQGTTSSSATFLQGRYNSVSWCPPKKFIVTENFGEWWENGGSPFTEANGNTLTKAGLQMYSLEGFTRWNPTQGKKGGFGAFYFDRDYNNSAGPYSTVRSCIQIANPAVQ